MARAVSRGSPGVVPSTHQSGRSLPDKWLARALLWPAVLVLALVLAYPLAYSFYLSLTNYNPTRPSRFVGARNYVRILQDSRVWESLATTVTFATISLALQLVIGFGIALALHRVKVFQSLVRGLIIVPLLLTPVVMGINWRLMLNFDFGVVNYFAGLLGFEAQDWVNDPTTAMASLILVDVWQTTSFTVLVASAGLASLPEEPFEAASIDGANGWQKLWSLTIPMLRPLILIILLFRSYELLRVYDVVYVLTHGGPGNQTETISLHIFNRMFQGFQIGYSSAVSYVLFAISLICSAVIIKGIGVRSAFD